MEQPLSPDAAKSFDRSAGVYDDYVAPNRAGARRLVASIPEGRYPRLLDVACGTGFAALAAIPRLGVESVVGVDASAPMLEQFRERLAEYPDVRADLRACDVLATDVPEGSVDLVLCSMALHWFTERPAAIALMARALAPGGVLGILAPGPGHDAETVALINRTGDPLMARLAESILSNEVDPDVLTGYLVAAGLEPLDVFTETRSRATPASFYSGRLDAVASHLWSDLPPAEQEQTLARMHALIENAADHEGLYRYHFVKTYAVARKRRQGEELAS